MLKLLRCAFFALILTPASGTAQDFDAGVTAFDAGDYETALREWRPLAYLGDARSQLVLGLMYANGIGVPQDHAEAVRWYRAAAEQGDADGQYNLGVMYDEGYGVPQDHAEAARWYRAAAEQGSALAQFNLAGMYDFGAGVQQDHISAHMWANIAAANGHEFAGFFRADLAQKLTPADVSEAQRRARVCMSSGYQDCY